MDNYEETRQDYDKAADWHTQKSLSYNWNNQIERFVEALNGKKVLDIGCGGGRDIPEFLKRGLQVEGIDYSKETIKKVKETFPEVTFHECDIRKMDLPDNE